MPSGEPRYPQTTPAVRRPRAASARTVSSGARRSACTPLIVTCPAARRTGPRSGREAIGPSATRDGRSRVTGGEDGPASSASSGRVRAVSVSPGAITSPTTRSVTPMFAELEDRRRTSSSLPTIATSPPWPRLPVRASPRRRGPCRGTGTTGAPTRARRRRRRSRTSGRSRRSAAGVAGSLGGAGDGRDHMVSARCSVPSTT